MSELSWIKYHLVSIILPTADLIYVLYAQPTNLSFEEKQAASQTEKNICWECIFVFWMKQKEFTVVQRQLMYHNITE